MSSLRAALVLLLIVVHTLLHAVPLLLLALCKAVLPFAGARRSLGRGLARIAESWIATNNRMLDRLTPTRFHVSGDEGLLPGGHSLVLATHKSWVNIFVLKKFFNRRIPLMRFFLKQQLFWVPVLGLAWWALDFPFMGRYSRAQIAKDPALGQRDMEATRRACEKFRDMPVAVMNFVEGTRFTPEKHARQASPYRHLLKPKAGGVAFVIDAMGDALHAILDVTIAYPAGRPTMIDLVGGRVPEVHVRVRQRPIPDSSAMGGRYQDDRAARARFQQWLNGIWQDKDAALERLQG